MPPDLDTGLTPNDICVFMRADAADTGPSPTTHARQVFPVWWLSPDIELNPGTANSDKAIASSANTVNVKFTLKSGCALPVDTAGISRVRTQLYVGNPNLVMTPGSNTKQIGTGLVQNPGAGRNVKSFTWTLPVPTPSDPDPESVGHKCLIARCFPRDLTPDAGAFHQIEDPHVAQRNICIITCSSPCGLDVITVNPNRKRSEAVIVSAVADLAPSRHVLSVVNKSLKYVKGFERLSREIPPPFKLRFKDFPDAELRDFTGKPVKGVKASYRKIKGPSYEAEFVMKPKQVTRFRFMTDLDKAKFGEAHIYHLMHINENKEVIGGLTVVAVRLRKGAKSRKK